MRRYETIFILDPDASEEQRGSVFGRLTDLMGQKTGLQVALDEWGAKKLAYEIKKKHRGYYVRLDYCGGGELVDEIERFFRIDDRVLKYMTIVVDKDADIEQVKQEMADATAKVEAAAAKAAEATAAAAKAAEAAAAAEAKAATESKPAPATESTPEPEAKATPAPATESTPEPEAKATPAPATESTPEPEAKATPEPETESTPEPETESTPEPETEPTPELAKTEGDAIETDQEKGEA